MEGKERGAFIHHLGRGLVDVAEPVKALVGDGAAGLGRVCFGTVVVQVNKAKRDTLRVTNGAEGVVLSGRRAVGERVEQRRLADVGETDDTGPEVVGRASEHNAVDGGGGLWRHCSSWAGSGERENEANFFFFWCHHAAVTGRVLARVAGGLDGHCLGPSRRVRHGGRGDHDGDHDDRAVDNSNDHDVRRNFGCPVVVPVLGCRVITAASAAVATATTAAAAASQGGGGGGSSSSSSNVWRERHGFFGVTHSRLRTRSPFVFAVVPKVGLDRFRLGMTFNDALQVVRALSKLSDIHGSWGVKADVLYHKQVWQGDVSFAETAPHTVIHSLDAAQL